jgi:coproporphyrinogen III oxidase-like Fe-S oxidoreductase
MLPVWLTRVMRRMLVGPEQIFRMVADHDPKIPLLRDTHLYVHVPFCRNVCAYCPYCKVKYDRRLVAPFVRALRTEISLYRERLGRCRVRSIYFGGGTPTLLGAGLGEVIGHLRRDLNVVGDIALETNPLSVTPEAVRRLQADGVTMISLGGQSFNDRTLERIGRNYSGRETAAALRLLARSGFKSVNLDLMFAIPHQSTAEVLEDVGRAMDLGADQITLYPLFTFPYTSVGRYLRLKHIRMPDLVKRYVTYKAVHRFCLQRGFRPVSVWGFKRGPGPRYSSVTRESFLGLGPSGGSFYQDRFTLNTFSFPAYLERLSAGRLPVALTMEVTPSLAKYYWLYWRLYDTRIPKTPLHQAFGEHDAFLKALFLLSRWAGLHDESEDEVLLNRRGAFWIHLLQNSFFLQYVNRIWTAAGEDPWPTAIEL